MYDACHPSRPEKTIPINAKIGNMSAQTSISGTAFLSCPDEAVSFDFGPPYEDVSRSGRDPNKRVQTVFLVKTRLPILLSSIYFFVFQDSVPIFLFPVYVLLGNGDVYTFSCSVQSNRY